MLENNRLSDIDIKNDSEKDNGMVYLKNKEVEINRLIGLGCKDIEDIGLTEVRVYTWNLL